MNARKVNPSTDWYEVANRGDGVRPIHEPWINPFYHCTMWHVTGRDRDMLADTGHRYVSLVCALPWLAARPLVTVLCHTHFDHIGPAHEFPDRLGHPVEAGILANQATLADPSAADAILDAFPPDWDTARYRVLPAPATGFINDGDMIDLSDRRFTMMHTPGHSPGGIALFEEAAGIMIAGEATCDGPLVTDCYHSDMFDYVATVTRLRAVPARIVCGGYFGSSGRRATAPSSTGS